MSSREPYLNHGTALRKSVRVAHVVLSLQPGGLERFICNLTTSSDVADVDMSVLCLDQAGELAELVTQAGGTVFVVKRRPGFDIGLVFRLAREFRARRIQVVHTHGLDPMLYAGCAAMIARVRNRIHTQHNTFLDVSSFRDRLKFRLASYFFTKLVAVSEQTRMGMLRAGAPAKRTVTIINGIEAHRYGCSRTQNGKIVIGCVARLASEKGIDQLVRAFHLVSSRYPRVCLQLVGDGPLRSPLQTLVTSLGLNEQVEFRGYVSDVRTALSSFDVFVLPSISEGVPLALLEAMAAGLPIVATRVGGIPEVIVDQESGVLVSAHSSTALADAIAELIGDEGKRAALGAQALLRVRADFSLSLMAKRYRSLYLMDQYSVWRHVIKSALRMVPKRLLCWRANRKRPLISITFDDGPDSVYTPQILDILRGWGARATFFLVGQHIAMHPDMVRRIADEGHEIANHSYTHPDFEKLSMSEAIHEIRETQGALDAIRHGESRFFRPPKGKLCFTSLLAAWRCGLTAALWSIDLKDFRAADATEIVECMRQGPMAFGDVVLYHANTSAAIKALPRVLEAATATGAKLVTLSQLLDSQGT